MTRSTWLTFFLASWLISLSPGAGYEKRAQLVEMEKGPV